MKTNNTVEEINISINNLLEEWNISDDHNDKIVTNIRVTIKENKIGF